MYKILIIDDEPSNIDQMFNALLNENYDVLIATNGISGCEIALQNEPQLIITDWKMPEFSGIEVIKYLKQQPQTRNIPIIMATGIMTNSENLAIALEAGAVDFIRKPIDVIELKARVSTMLLLFENMKKNIELQTQLMRQRNEQMKNEILTKKQDLAKLSLRIMQNSDISAKLFDGLNQLSKRTDKEGLQIINKLISEYKSETMNINWDEFDILFAQVHKAFYDKLNNIFPDLTKSERKLCIFYKLNMNSKEICSLTMQTENALKKARSRLRKKLNVKTSEKISAFLQQLV